jgi:hypothetical protein
MKDRIVGCARDDDMSEVDRATIAHAVEHAWADMLAAATALDADRIRAGYAAHPIVAINGVIIEDFDRDQFAATRGWLNSLRLFEADYDNVHLDVLGPASAVATMNHHLRWTDAAGLKGEWNSAWTAVFRCINGRWQVVYSHESVPAAAN